MKILIKAKPGAKTEGVKQVSALFENKNSPQFIVSVKEKPTNGSANRAIEKVMAKHFGVPVSRVRIISGHAAREKIIEILRSISRTDLPPRCKD